MNARKFLIIAAIVAIPLVIGAVIFGWTVNSVFAQGPWQGSSYRTMHSNQALWQLLQSDPDFVLQQRQAGTSWLDLATAKGVSEQALLDVLAQPMNEMHTWMQQQYPQTDTSNMTDAMRQQFARDIRVAAYGTMTDMHVFGMNGNYGMMGGMMQGGMMNAPQNGAGMMGGGMMGGMMHGNNGYGGMMNGGMMQGGMMHGNNAPAVNATAVPSTQKADREITINAKNFKFEPSAVTVKKGETVKFIITNQDNFAHNVISQDGKLAYAFLPANQTTTVLWSAPTQAGTYNFICTFHPNMQFTVTVE